MFYHVFGRTSDKEFHHDCDYYHYHHHCHKCQHNYYCQSFFNNYFISYSNRLMWIKPIVSSMNRLQWTIVLQAFCLRCQESHSILVFHIGWPPNRCLSSCFIMFIRIDMHIINIYPTDEFHISNSIKIKESCGSI